jgi:hypothetical protein
MSSNLDSQHKGVPVNRTRIPNVPAARALLLAGALALSAPAAVLTVDARTVSGTVVSASGSSLVVKTSVGKTTFKLTSSTHYLVNGKATTSRPTLKAGQAIHVMGASSGSMRTAQLVIIGAMPAPPSGPPPGQ